MKPTQRVIAAALDLRTFTVPQLAKTADVNERTVRSTLNRYGENFTKSSTPTGQRGGQLQTWTVLADRQDQLRELLKSRGDPDAAATSDRLTLSENGELSSKLGQRTRTPGALRELVTEDELHEYDTYAASRLLPELLVRLILTDPGLVSFSMRSGFGIGFPGFDGRVESASGSFPVPRGFSVWEMGAGSDWLKKANGDYRKRTRKPDGIDRATTTFVFVTNHRASKLQEWATTKAALAEWADVRGIDSETLFKWLLKNRAVHVWLSERMGLRPSEVASLDNWFSEWRVQTDPVIPHVLLTAGRTREAEQLRHAALREGETIGVYSSSREESLAFVASALSPEPVGGREEDMSTEVSRVDPDFGRFASVLIVRTAEEWSRIVTSKGTDGVLVPLFDGADVASAKAVGLTVIIPMGLGDDQSRATIVLPRLDVIAATECLTASGVPYDSASGVAQAIDRSLPSFRRTKSVNPTHKRPRWANERAALIAPLSLLGSWNSDCADDQGVVSRIVQRNYVDVEQELQLLAADEDSPFVASGNNWQLVSPEDAYALVGTTLTKATLEIWVSIALEVLQEPNPLDDLDPDESFQASVKGVSRRHSGALRTGIARGAALLGSSDQRLHGAVSVADYARRLVRELLLSKPDEATWRTLADVLPLLAEAAPDEFLSAVGSAMQGSATAILRMFTDEGPAPLFGGDSPHVHLLWALELLAQSEEFAAEALYQLARLADIDPGGRLGNRPSGSLQRLLTVWLPQTAASRENRLSIVTQICRRHPEVGWTLVVALLPHLMAMSDRAYRPTFRDWHPSTEVTISDVMTAYGEYASLALELARQDQSRWAELVSVIQDLPNEDRDIYISSLESVDPDQWSREVRLANSRSLSALVAKHREFPDAKWVMPDEAVDRLDAIATTWQPTDLVDRYAPLFAAYPDLPGVKKFPDHDDYERKVTSSQQDALEQILASRDPAALSRLVYECPDAAVVGSTLAALADKYGDADLYEWLGGSEKLRAAARGWLHRSLGLRGQDWQPVLIGHIAKLDEGARAYAYSLLRALAVAIDAVAGDSPGVQASFWGGRGVEYFGCDRHADIVSGLIAHDNAGAAPQYLYYRSLHNYVDPELIVTALRAAIGDAEALNNSSSIHELGQLLDKLEATGADLEVLAQLELDYFPLLQHERAPRAYFHLLGEDPRYFVSLVENVFRASSDPTPEAGAPVDPHKAGVARISYSILRLWRTPPGLSSRDQMIDSAKLKSWITQARELLDASDRVGIGDECIGQLLSGSPKGSDGIWPAEPIRDLLEEVSSQHILDGLAIGEFNARGATVRGPADGGKQERGLSAQFDAWALQVSPRWPSTGRLLRELARTYEKWAAREDSMSEVWRDSF